MRNVLSVAELQAVDDQYVSWDIMLPEHVDPERITVDVSHARTMGRIAGFSHVVFGEYRGEPALPQGIAIAGALDGVATAAAAGAAVKRETSRAHLTSDSELARDYQRPIANLQANRQTLVDRVIERKQNTANDTQAWSIELNRAYNSAFRRAARQNLLADHPDDITMAISAAAMDGALLGHDTNPMVAGVFYGAVMMGSLKKNKDATGTFHIRKKRWSLFPGVVQPDLLLLASAASLFRTIEYRK